MSYYHVIVAGGGFAGVSAALAAARQGLKVLLIEKASALGGAAVNCLVNPFMPHGTKINQEYQFLSRGIFSEIKQKLKEVGACADARSFKEEELKLILNRMTRKAGVDLLFHSYLYDIIKNESNIKSVIVANKSGSQTFEADYFIDATGDADLATISGCPVTIGREEDHLSQPMTLCFRMNNVDLEIFKKEKESINALYQEAQKKGEIENPRENVLIFHYPIDGVLHFNTTRIVKRNPVNAQDLTIAEIEAREQVFEMVSFLKTNFKAFANSSLIMTAAEIGVRESRMIKGKHILTRQELVDCTKFEDAIAAGNYDIDIHNPEGSGTSHYYFSEGTYYTIPYRSLQPLNVDNLLVAGRCISSDHEAQASYRIMPICSTLGEAAGIAAAIACKQRKSFENADIRMIQNTLKENGAFIGI